MKISIESAHAGYLNNINTNIKAKQAVSAQETGRNFDQLVISSNSRQVAENQLETAAKKDVASAVFQPTSDEKIASLKQQVAEGMYKVDPEAIAAKIFWLGGE